MNTARFHCDALMVHTRVVLKSGHSHHEYRCVHCRYHDREVRTSRGALISWRNLSRLAREASARV